MIVRRIVPALALAAVLAHPAPARAGDTPSPLGAAARSLVLPGWGQISTGHKTQAAIFLGLEVGTWVAYGVWHGQGELRQDSYYDTARLYAGIDLEGKDDKFEKLVGQYQSSDVYNQYVVNREGAYFYTDPDQRAQYIATKTIQPADAWSWDSYDAFLRYGEQRRSSEHAFQRAQYAVSFAIINRVVSAIAAAKQAASLRQREKAGEDLGALPAPGDVTSNLAFDVAPGKGFVPDTKVAWVVRF